MSNFNDEIEAYPDDSYNVDSDEENSDGRTQMKKIKCINLFFEKVRNLFFYMKYFQKNI